MLRGLSPRCGRVDLPWAFNDRRDELLAGLLIRVAAWARASERARLYCTRGRRGLEPPAADWDRSRPWPSCRPGSSRTTRSECGAGARRGAVLVPLPAGPEHGQAPSRGSRVWEPRWYLFCPGLLPIGVAA